LPNASGPSARTSANSSGSATARLRSRIVDQLKEGRVGADAERQRDDRHRREDRASSQQPQSVTGVANQVVRDAHPALIAACLFLLVDPAHRAQGGVTRLRGIHAPFDVQRDLALDVVPQLFVELAIDPVRSEQRSQTERAT
jgi:hypothetical protein